MDEWPEWKVIDGELVRVGREVAPLAPKLTSELPKARASYLRIALIASGVALGLSGLAINAHFARSLGSTEFSGWLFLAVGVASDIAAFVLPTWALALPRWRAAAAWALWSVTFGFALIASVGFASLNIADTAIERAGRSTPAIVDAQLALADAKAARDRECIRVRRPMCQRREDEVVARQGALDAARRSLVADPQTEGAARLFAWLTRGQVAVDPGMLRLALLTLLPQIGGLLLPHTALQKLHGFLSIFGGEKANETKMLENIFICSPYFCLICGVSYWGRSEVQSMTYPQVFGDGTQTSLKLVESEEAPEEGVMAELARAKAARIVSIGFQI